MKNRNSSIVTLIYLILVVFAFISGTKIGTFAYSYKTVVAGIVGSVNLLFTYLLFIRWNPKVSKLFDPQIHFPQDIKYVILTFLIYLIIYWSTRLIIDALLYLKALASSA
jgi:hypothetical protein